MSRAIDTYILGCLIENWREAHPNADVAHDTVLICADDLAQTIRRWADTERNAA